MMRKGTVLMLCTFFCAAMIGFWLGAAEAAPQVGVAKRELKKSRDYQGPSNLYERAHRIIYGPNGPAGGPGGRPTIAVVIDGDQDLIDEDRVKDEIYTQLRKKFPWEDFAVMKGSDLETVLMQNEEDKGVDTWGGKSDRALDKDGLPIPYTQPNGIAYVKRGDLVQAGRECNYDYIFGVTLSHGPYYEEEHPILPSALPGILPPVLSSTTYKKAIWTRVRFVDVNSGDYLYRRDIVAYGETGGTFSGRARKYQWGVRKAMQEALSDIEITY